VGVLQARGITKTVGRGRAARLVLHRAALEVDAGEVVAVLGRSGSGKSTLLHLLGGLDRPDAGEIVLIEELGLTGVADHLPHELSGGEQQRFAIARALVNDPELVLADEPTGNLDAESGATVLALLRNLSGRAVVIVTHEPEAAATADRVLRLSEGRLAADRGSANELSGRSGA
jgi:ABC-type lipoprotein export system ATPase subunit